VQPFAYLRADRIEDAIAASGPDARFLAGGTNLVDLMKSEVERPQMFGLARWAEGRSPSSASSWARRATGASSPCATT
jgi:hypothetical protein